MHSRKRLITGLAAAAVVAGGIVIIPRTFAAEITSPAPPLSGLVDKIAGKFNLNKAEVQAVFDEDRTARETERQAKMKEMIEQRLSQAVTDGKLTQAQKDLITAKLAEVEPKMKEAMVSTDQGNRRATLDQLQADLSKWAVQNNIDPIWVRVGAGRIHGHGYGGKFEGPGFGMH